MCVQETKKETFTKIKNQQHAAVIKNQIEWRVGSGDKFRFWEDSWVGAGVSLMAKYPKLYNISNQQYQLISSVGSQKDAGWEWSFSWRRSLCENEIGMAAEFLQELAQVKIQQNRPDLWVSKAHPSGNYSTKSTYRLRIACQEVWRPLCEEERSRGGNGSSW